VTQPAIHYLEAYAPSLFSISETSLKFEIFDTHTLVTNTMKITAAQAGETLTLNGEKLELLSLTCNGSPVTEYTLDAQYLSITDFPSAATLEVVTRIYPHQNTELEGLYHSGDMFCTQNEPEGFRRITYTLDRPDVMSVFSTRIEADQKREPILLSNGNLSETGLLEGGRHYALWHDPFPKPTYLFALVAGDLGSISDTFTTMSGRDIALNIFCDIGNEERCHHAMRSLKKAMTWDEETYGREYDLDIYNIVAVESFNMGAMENKGLNIFNAAYVLADEERATDANFLGIESVIAHEYFHNWTGNRITCRDWFQLTLKEGLTVFRDQCFSADMNEASTQRISDVKALRERQFVEDASATAHPIKPEKYIEINNFYTATVYEKGAEVIRMLHTMLGEARWRRAMDLYFETFDGQAVRTEDFLWAISRGGDIDLTQFERWYHQERTPILHVSGSYDEKAQTYTLNLRQEIPKNVHHADQLPYHFPLAVALFDADGNMLPLQLEGETALHDLERGVLHVTDSESSFLFKGVARQPVVSVNRNFSAPFLVKQEDSDYAFLMRHERDGFIRYEASQQFATEVLFAIMAGGSVAQTYLEAFGTVLHDAGMDPMLKSQILELPSDVQLSQLQKVMDIDAIAHAKKILKSALFEQFEKELSSQYELLHDPFSSELTPSHMGRRALKNLLLSYLISSQKRDYITLAELQYEQSVTMTDRITALDLLENFAPIEAEDFLNEFYESYHDDMLVMTKYFSILAAADRTDVLDRVIALQNDPVYDEKVPNLVRSLLGVFARNLRHFHDASGDGYRFVAEKIIALDRINPMIAAGLSGAFKSYDRLDDMRRAHMSNELKQIMSVEGISKNVYEIVEKIYQG